MSTGPFVVPLDRGLQGGPGLIVNRRPFPSFAARTTATSRADGAGGSFEGYVDAILARDATKTRKTDRERDRCITAKS
jgi:uncharacterized protein YigE (DUF2233 family)